jgi:hypothetical protein
MTFKFGKMDGKYIHTLYEGELLYRVSLIPEQIIGKELHEFLPKEDAEKKLSCYERAWNGEEDVMYEDAVNGIGYIAALHPVRQGGQVVAVIGTCIHHTKSEQVIEGKEI